MKMFLVVGTRPNFVKIAPIVRALEAMDVDYELIHTGQHYDWCMSESFFEGLDIPKPDANLGMKSTNYAALGSMMGLFEDLLNRRNPDVTVVVGDVDSTLACSLVVARLNRGKLAHVEAGLRSFDRTMPEEISRIVTDSLSDYLFVDEESGLGNLRKEGISSDKVYFVGNVMIDTLLASLDAVAQSSILEVLGLAKNEYSVMTLHRPSNVDSKKTLLEILDILKSVSTRRRMVYSIHPRAKKMIEAYSLWHKFIDLSDFMFVRPLAYIDFIKLVKDSSFVLTDSGGVQEETTMLGVPCLTMRENTERPVTVEEGTNYLVGRDRHKIMALVDDVLDGRFKRGSIPELWDGKTAERIVAVLSDVLEG